jgi:hypothetical protein
MSIFSEMGQYAVIGGIVGGLCDHKYDLFPTLTPVESVIACAVGGALYPVVDKITTLIFGGIQSGVTYFCGDRCQNDIMKDNAWTKSVNHKITEVKVFANLMSVLPALAFMEKQLAVIPYRGMYSNFSVFPANNCRNV